MGDVEKENEIQWMKPGGYNMPCILGKDVAILASGNFINFIETSRPDKKELIYNANNEVRGDGIQCITTHKTLPCFAFSEMCRNPRILIVSYPNFEVFKSFECVTETHYIALKFSEVEYLVALTGIPDYKIVIWNWRTSEKIFTQETKLRSPIQFLNISPSSPIQILQNTTTDRQMILWTMNVCYKKIIVNKFEQLLPKNSDPPYCFCFGGDGELYYVDFDGSLFMITSDTHACVLQLLGQGHASSNYVPCICWYKGGLVFTTPENVQFWKKKSPEGWTPIWVYAAKVYFTTLLSSSVKDYLLGFSQWNEMFVFKGETQVECSLVRSYGVNFEFVCFIYPVGDYFVTFGNLKQLFTVWDKTNGHKVSELHWSKDIIMAMESNPKRPYLAVSTRDGRITIINTYDPSHLMQLDEIALTRNALNAVRFGSHGIYFCAANMDIGEFFVLKLPGKVDVVGYIRIDYKIVDYVLYEAEENKLNLLVLPMSQLCCRSGNNLLLYSVLEKFKTLAYVREIVMPWHSMSIKLSPNSTNELFCVLHRSRQIGVMNVQNGRMINKWPSGHQMKIIYMKCFNDYLLTYGADGIVIVSSIPTQKCLTIFSCHHRLAKGVQTLALDPYVKYIITLGGRGSLVCTMFKKIGKMHLKHANEEMLFSPLFKQMFQTPLINEKAKAKALEKLFQQNPDHAKNVVADMKLKKKIWEKVWLELKEDEILNQEEQKSRKEKTSIVEELDYIRNKVKEMLDKNLENVPEKQIPVQYFDLDVVTRRKKLEDSKTEREKEKQIQLAQIKNLNRITDIIKKVCWESVSVKEREIHGILTPTIVKSYALLPEDSSSNLKLTWLRERLQTEEFFRAGDFFEPWVPRDDSSLELHVNRKFQVSSVDITHTIKTKFKEEPLDDEKVKTNIEEEQQKFVWTGTSSHNFIQVDPNHYNQFELLTFLQGHREIRLIQIDIKKLMLWFNKEFKETFALKEQEMAFIYDRNNRFRHIISELSFFHFSPQICKTQIIDPKWAPEENPETIMTVEDDEITVPKYISDSEMELLNAKKAEEEKLKQLLMADDFKEKALVVMMDGVLEKLWEDEIKKDPQKPKCMVEKEPETWNEEDLRAMKAYEESLKVLAIERERYRKILEEKWTKTVAAVKDSVAKFDEKVMKLHFLKLKVESAIGQETLKCLRIRQRCFLRMEMDRKEENIKSNLFKNEKKLESMNSELSKLIEALNECKNYYETLQNKERNLDKNFKKEFPDYSPVICEQLYKLSKKRPKLLQKAAAYSTILNDMGKCAVTGSKPENLPSECIQYLKDIDALDANSNAPTSVSQQTWELACKLRRGKIETELKIRACGIDLADAEATVSSYQKSLKATKDYQVQLLNDLQALRDEKLNFAINGQIQLVMKKGLVEVPLTGRISDFNECILVTKETLNEVNKAIQKMGLQKIKAMQKAANFRKGIIYKEWEHKKLRMEIEDLKSKLDTVEKLQVLKELQAILAGRARGFPEEKGFLYIENEISKVKERFQKSQSNLLKKIDDLDLKIQKIIFKNQNLNDKIEEINVEVNELELERDKEFDQKNLAANQKRMKKIRERSKLVRTIHEQHKEILILQGQLELLRLKTYPSIKHKIT